MFRANADMILEVTDSTFDGIALQAAADPTMFPFLSGLPHQHPALDPSGGMFLQFRFPSSYLSSDAFTTAIDPLATARNPGRPNPTGIYQRVEAASLQSPTSAFPEWFFQFDIDPLSFDLSVLEGELTGTYAGTVAFLNRGEFTPNAPVPEPSSIVLVLSGWLLLRRTISSRSRRVAGS
jgi:hypothetical protein